MEDDDAEQARQQLPDNIHWYVAMRACEEFYRYHKRYPGQCSEHEDNLLKADFVQLKTYCESLLKSWDLGDVMVEQTLEEM